MYVSCDAVGQQATLLSSSELGGLPSTSRPAGRVLRPMIVAKQLDLPEGPSGSDTPSALPMPRTQLTRELEKYSRPATAVTVASTIADSPVCLEFSRV